jgi:predicted hydrocarbon binding protein
MSAPKVKIDVDPVTGVWQTDELPMIYLPRHFLVNNHKATEKALGRDAYSAMIQGATDKSAFDWCSAQYQRGGAAVEDIVQLYFERLSQRGWGQFHIDSLDVGNGDMSLSLSNSVFVLEAKEASAQSLCYMFEGFVTGALRFLLPKNQKGGRFHCQEIACEGQGHNQTCQFNASFMQALSR